MKEIPIVTLPLIDLTSLKDDLPFGVSIYRGVLIVWDEDYDVRVIAVLDGLINFYESQQILAANESEGYLRLVWNTVPSREPTEVQSPSDGDVWSVENVGLHKLSEGKF